MKPYYDDGQITIYCGDCLDVLPHLGPADAVVTDPPYNAGVNYGGASSDRRHDYAEWCAAWFRLCRSVAPLVAFTPGQLQLPMWYAIDPPKWVLAWLKPAAMRWSQVGFNNWEPVLVWGDPKGKRSVDTFTAPIIPDPAVAGHPCPKPLLWGRYLVTMMAPSGGLVVDPFAGTGTVLRAAKDTGRRAIGVEINRDYCEIAVKRLAQQALSLAV